MQRRITHIQRLSTHDGKISVVGKTVDSKEIVRLTGFTACFAMLTPEFRKKLAEVLKRNKGSLPLTMFLYDPETKYRIQFHSKKYFVAPSNELLSDLAAIGVTDTEVINRQ